jgi:hypothetical protein
MATPVTKIVCKPLPAAYISVDSGEGEKSYTLYMNCNAAIKAEQAIGIDLSKPGSWKALSANQLTTIVWAELDRCHPEITLHEVGQWLAPAQWSDVWLMLFEQSFPGLIERLDTEKLTTEVKA